MLVTLLEKVWSLLYIRNCCCRGNKGSVTEISSCAIHLTEIVIETWNLTKSNSMQVLHNRI